jgi:hypothetical protein
MLLAGRVKRVNVPAIRDHLKEPRKLYYIALVA